MNTKATFSLDSIRAQFPMLRHTVDGKPYCYLDSAATALKPDVVIDGLSRFYREEYATVRRGAYRLSHASTAQFEAARATAARFIGASRPEEIVFVRGCTEGINLVAIALGWSHFKPGDEILVSTMEHHSNIVSWQLVAQRTGAVVRPIPITDTGELDLDAYRKLLSDKTKFVSVVHVSNGLGTVNPVAEVCRLAHEVGALTLVDGAQSAPHLPIDVQAIGCDFFVSSGHKMYGPTGIGFLWGRYDLLASMDPYQGGGEMIDRVSFEGTTYDAPPYRFEAGTPAFAQAVGLKIALDWLSDIGMETVHQRGQEILSYATERMLQVPGLKIFGTAAEKSGLVSFLIDGIHASDIGSILDQEGIAIRVGQHCVQPVMDRFGVHSTARASFGIYTSEEEVDRLVAGLHLVRELLA